MARKVDIKCDLNFPVSGLISIQLFCINSYTTSDVLVILATSILAGLVFIWHFLYSSKNIKELKYSAKGVNNHIVCLHDHDQIKV